MPHTLTVAEVAARLGVKRETVYAYVSRGTLTSRRSPDGRGSLFDADQVAQLAARRRTGRGESPSGGLTVETALTVIEGQRPFYRGLDVVDLTGVASFEQVAHWLWRGEHPGGDTEKFAASAEQLALAGRVAATLPARARALDRMRTAVCAVACCDPLRGDLSAPGVAATGASILSAMVAALGPADDLEGSGADGDAEAGEDHRVGRGCRGSRDAGMPPTARRLAVHLTGRGVPPAALVALVDAALVLLADHDLAASTLAARVAASTRADPYAVVLAGLGALDGLGHGAASTLAYAMLRQIAEAADTEGGALAVAVPDIAGRLVGERGGLPGFGHFLYPDGDPRGSALLDRVDELPPLLADPSRREVVRAIRDLAATRGWHPNVDFGLAAAAYVAGLPADAGTTVFAVARTAGWLAHAIEEYAGRPGRFRPRGRYVGPSPRHP